MFWKSKAAIDALDQKDCCVSCLYNATLDIWKGWLTVLLGELLQLGSNAGVPLVKGIHMRLEHADLRTHLVQRVYSSTPQYRRRLNDLIYGDASTRNLEDNQVA